MREHELAAVGAQPGRVTNSIDAPTKPGGGTGGRVDASGTSTHTGNGGNGAGVSGSRTEVTGAGRGSGSRGSGHGEDESPLPGESRGSTGSESSDSPESHGQDTHDPTDKADDPAAATPAAPHPPAPITRAEYDAYVATLETRGANYGTAAARHFQRQVTGSPIEYELSGSGQTIWGDGLAYDPNTSAVALEAKYVDKPGKSSIYEGTAPGFILDDEMVKFESEMVRYAHVIADTFNPVSRLEIVTSTEAARVYLSTRMEMIVHRILADYGIVLPYIVRVGP